MNEVGVGRDRVRRRKRCNCRRRKRRRKSSERGRWMMREEDRDVRYSNGKEMKDRIR